MSKMKNSFKVKVVHFEKTKAAKKKRKPRLRRPNSNNDDQGKRLYTRTTRAHQSRKGLHALAVEENIEIDMINATH